MRPPALLCFRGWSLGVRLNSAEFLHTPPLRLSRLLERRRRQFRLFCLFSFSVACGRSLRRPRHSTQCIFAERLLDKLQESTCEVRRKKLGLEPPLQSMEMEDLKTQLLKYAEACLKRADLPRPKITGNLSANSSTCYKALSRSVNSIWRPCVVWSVICFTSLVGGFLLFLVRNGERSYDWRWLRTV